MNTWLMFRLAAAKNMCTRAHKQSIFFSSLFIFLSFQTMKFFNRRKHQIVPSCSPLHTANRLTWYYRVKEIENEQRQRATEKQNAWKGKYLFTKIMTTVANIQLLCCSYWCGVYREKIALGWANGKQKSIQNNSEWANACV